MEILKNERKYYIMFTRSTEKPLNDFRSEQHSSQEHNRLCPLRLSLSHLHPPQTHKRRISPCQHPELSTWKLAKSEPSLPLIRYP